jgi:cysteinyl-tRNA synthetase
MAGSVGNVVNVVDLLKKYQPETVRFLLLSTHYRSPIEYSDDRLQEVKRSLESFYRFFERYERITGESFHALKAPQTKADHDAAEAPGEQVLTGKHAYFEFCTCMDDDFNTGGAIGKLYEFLTLLNKFADGRHDFHDQETHRIGDYDTFKHGVLVLKELSQMLGLFHEPSAKGADDQLVGGLMQLLLDLRAEARKSKNFAMADVIRKRLTELGVTLEDRPGVTGWRVG